MLSALNTIKMEVQPITCAGQSRKVLVVEDEALILMDLSMALEVAGYRVTGEALSLGDARRLLKSEKPEVAVLDINVGNETVWPLARELAGQGIALVFVSANLHHEQLRDEFAGWPRLEKPVECAKLVTAIEAATTQAKT
ncbi:response regulator [Paraurantiacibacter namhicola]|uniref:Putative transcriptional regulatory protein pdtaR n=1 Tax=Paraurantiacibacter namhicola TaxID=645517 RepID=A0A1C7D6X3_9SPHN|nr:response regulator [Paraurantiacibacter namhicola]ANU07053.1 putative transcriptional regulatory protein pdtaR [Paraurantiacibacter namhicola]